MSTTHNRVAMSPDELPRQRLFEIVGLPAEPEGFRLLNEESLQDIRPLEPGPQSALVVQAEWAWSPMHNRVSNWEIGPDETGLHWVLWSSYRSDECEPADWCDPDEDEDEIEWVAIWYSQVVAACTKSELSQSEASIYLLQHAWEEERDSMELDPPHFYGAAGVLRISVLRSIELSIWGEK